MNSGALYEALSPRRSPTSDEIYARAIHLEERRFVSDYIVDERTAFHMKESVMRDEPLGAIRMRVAGAIYAEMDRRIVVKQEPQVHAAPKTWWDAFKNRWFPQWACKRWPVEFVVLTVPRISIDEPVYKACYVNLPIPSLDGGINLFELLKPEHQREKWRT